ncbi:MAG TPA: coenzyme F420-0:L-glutamate ligase [Dehalococcoidia bacterium]|nr:coenzyme F420-0:L-glutamate ligase [Dehalococcoidia bacterium]
MPAELRVFAVGGLPEVREGDDLGALIVDAMRAQGTPPATGDVVVVTQKVVSKAEGRVVDLATVEPSAFARQIADAWEKDARQVEVVLRESRRIVRMDRGVLICETRHGLVCANAGVDASNAAAGRVVLLPEDPDASARRIRDRVRDLTGCDVAVIVSDTFGRPWRNGLVNVAIGIAGMAALEDYSGQTDPAGYELRVTQMCWPDELAAAAELVMGKLDRVPVAVVRGLAWRPAEGSARELVREPEKDLFR